MTNFSEELLRDSLDKYEPLDEDNFACTILTYAEKEGVETDLVYILPEINRKIVFFINQFIYKFYLDFKDVPEFEKKMNLKKTEEMGIVKLPILEWINIRDSIVKSVVEISKIQNPLR